MSTSTHVTPRGGLEEAVGPFDASSGSRTHYAPVAHGKSFHDGGWFDARAASRGLKLRAAREVWPWETIGTLTEYPATTATDGKDLVTGQRFTLRLPQAITRSPCVGGVPACGDNHRQAFASCAELQAMNDVAPKQ